MTFKDFLIRNSKLSFNQWVAKLESYNDVGRELVKNLKHLPQGMKYHPELYVLRHTWLVYQALIERGAEELYESALFHDWGKYRTTLVHVNRNITSYGHAREGAKMLDDIKVYLDNDDFETTKWIVERHMDFDLNHKRFKERGQYDEPYDLLKTFVWADKVRSRELFFEKMDQFKLTFSNSTYENVYYENIYVERKLIDRIVYPSVDTPVLILPVGVSGSGKSTYIRKHLPYTKVVSPDLIRKEMLGYVGFDPSIEDEVWSTAYERTAKILEEGKNVIFDATNVTRFTRVKTIAQIESRISYPVRRKGIIFQPRVSDKKLRERIQKDLDDGIDRSDVPLNIISKQRKNFEDSLKEGFSDLHYLVFV